MYVTAYNTSTASVTVDAEGRQIGAHDWGTADRTGVAKDDFTAGTLVQVDVPDGGDVHPDAIAAAQRTEAVSSRAEALQAIDKSVLAVAAAEAEVPDAGEMGKPELVAALAARVDLPIPEQNPAEDDDVQATEEHDEQTPGEAGDPGERKARRRSS